MPEFSFIHVIVISSVTVAIFLFVRMKVILKDSEPGSTQKNVIRHETKSVGSPADWKFFKIVVSTSLLSAGLTLGAAYVVEVVLNDIALSDCIEQASTYKEKYGVGNRPETVEDLVIPLCVQFNSYRTAVAFVGSFSNSGSSTYGLSDELTEINDKVDELGESVDAIRELQLRLRY